MTKPRTTNTHATAQGWLSALIDELRPLYAAIGLTIPEKIRGTIAFTSRGKPGRDEDGKMRGQWPAECWPAAATNDDFVEIFIRADFADPLEIAGVLCHELIHACLGSADHGKEFRDSALRLGLDGKMRSALPGQALQARLNNLVEACGPLPRDRLNFDQVAKDGVAIADRPKKQTTRLLLAKCAADDCGFNVRVTAGIIREYGPPHCPRHGAMTTPLSESQAAAAADDPSPEIEE